MDIVILTGISGAGKSQAAAFFEDQGYFCIDNVPPQFLPEFAEIFAKEEYEAAKMDKLCFVVDVRSRVMLAGWGVAMQKLDEIPGVTYKVVFLEASDEVLVSRYRQTRRKHPLMDEMPLTDAIASERKLLHNIRGRASCIIDTTMLNNAGLKRALRDFIRSEEQQGFPVFVESFGFMYGIPSDSDCVYDMRFLPNPFWVDELKMLSGKDSEIGEYLNGFEETHIFMEKVKDIFGFMIPLYIKEGKSRLSIGIGCTGGRHRSVYIAEQLGIALQEMGYNTVVHHRDIDRDPRYTKKDTDNV
ncbi:UPF0042 nucleotide-binding protein [Ruminococcaceae bacterium KH2T8]|nr:UPF0042 nucleotide-binding protein [Ruminococcaceae bacterium KH2T8]